MNTFIGQASPLGATIIPGKGVNFSIFAPFAQKIELLLFQSDSCVDPIVIPITSKSHYYWHILVSGIGSSQLYGYRLYGKNDLYKGQYFDPSKVLTDPYSRAITHNYSRDLAKQPGVDNISSCMKSVVVEDNFDWKDEQIPQFTLDEAIIYEMHVSGFTKSPTSKLKLKGYFSSIIEKLPYLKQLGVNTLELMPIFAFDEYDAMPGKDNYWGYSPINFFSLHHEFCYSDDPIEAIEEFKQFIKAAHNQGFKIVLDVVFNHTTENGQDGPVYNFKGIGNSSYYILDQYGRHQNFSGCGNTIKANHSIVRRMIKDSLIYWVQEMHVDGFRFDLASILSRDEEGIPQENPPLLWSIDSQPELASAFLIAEPWDAHGLNQARNFAGDKWSIWNGEFRDTIRAFVKGDDGKVSDFVHHFTGSEGQAIGRHFKFTPKRHINFITAHDGFTLWDLVSYNEKHNLDNGENNRDGNSHNISWNCGIEGITEDNSINTFRIKQAKNFMMLLLLSHGVPMILMGDEILRTQYGNNNAYCQDNELSWMNWDIVQANTQFYHFVADLIKIRNTYSIFQYNNYHYKEIHSTDPYILLHGAQLHKPDWNNHSHSICIEMVYPKNGERLMLIANMFWESIDFQLPKGSWKSLICTSSACNIKLTQDKISLAERSCCLLVYEN